MSIFKKCNEHTVTVPPSIPSLVKCADWAQEVEAGVQGATQAGDEEREGEVCSPDSWPEVRARQSEGAAKHLRDFQPEKRWGDCMCIYLFSPVYNVLVSWAWIKYQTEI